MRSSRNSKNDDRYFICDEFSVPIANISYIQKQPFSTDDEYTVKTKDGGSFIIKKEQYQKLTKFIGDKKNGLPNTPGSSQTAEN